jgi:hydrogenase maturation protease
MGQVSIIGLGNVLMGDDGLGPTAVMQLAAEYDFPEEVKLLDLGTPGLSLIPYFCGPRALIIIDTVNSDGLAGDIKLYRQEQLMNSPLPARLSPHDPGFTEALHNASLLGELPESILLIGVIPGPERTETSLSKEVTAKLDHVKQEILSELKRLDITACRSVKPRKAETWWMENNA